MTGEIFELQRFRSAHDGPTQIYVIKKLYFPNKGGLLSRETPSRERVLKLNPTRCFDYYYEFAITLKVSHKKEVRVMQPHEKKFKINRYRIQLPGQGAFHPICAGARGRSPCVK